MCYIRYYKNVRNEWASLVATPPSAQFQDALAFTRSLGDFHLQTYGVSHLPMIRRIDVTALFSRLQKETLSRFPVTASVTPMPCSYLACLVVATGKLVLAPVTSIICVKGAISLAQRSFIYIILSILINDVELISAQINYRWYLGQLVI
jgi:hypothetical protein